ncbi:MAG: hypothetical protein JNL83_17120 [Myxococcales bacterium]|nr:hypothetical protein [Myxococcales bacterium]
MMRRYLLASILLAACNTAGERADTGECPVGEVCSAKTPRGLHFIGNTLADELFGGNGPAATAVGGTQEVALEYDRGDGNRIALNLPFEADDDGGLGVTVVSHSGSVVTVKGAKARSNYLRIVDPQTGELYDRYELTGAALKSMRLVGTSFEVTPTGRADLVFGPGEQEIAVALVGDVQTSSGADSRRIVDTSMILDLPGTTRTGWDSIKIANAQPGTYPLNVTAGDLPQALLPVEIVAAADAVTPLEAGTPTVRPGSSTTICFQATSNGRYIYGLTWTYTIDGQTIVKGRSELARNCVSVPAGNRTSGSIPVTAAAGGKQTSISVLVGAATLQAGGATKLETTTGVERHIPTAGDRASL